MCLPYRFTFIGYSLKTIKILSHYMLMIMISIECNGTYFNYKKSYTCIKYPQVDPEFFVT